MKKSNMGDKLAASVRESKQQQTDAAKPATQSAKAAKPEPAIKTIPACHVWPD